MKNKLMLLSLLILSFNVSANFLLLSELGKESFTVYPNKDKCPSECIYIDKNYNYKYSILTNVLSDNLESPIYSKNDVNNCGEYCQTLFNSGGTYTACTDASETAILNLDLEQIYCSKITGYNQKVIGQEIKEDPAKKAIYEAQEVQKNAINEAIQLGSLNSQKCKNALDFIAGQNSSSDMTIEQLDSMMNTEPYKSIFEALTANRIDKARLKLQEVTAPEFLTMKTVLLGILE